jgi:hypothetical protein
VSEARFPDVLKIEPAKGRWGSRLPKARILPFIIASLLAVATALDCHAHASAQLDLFVSLGFALTYGCVQWLWWALMADFLWQAGNRWPQTLKISPPGLTLLTLGGVAVVILHLGAMQLTTDSFARFGPKLIRDEYANGHFFCLPRFGMEMLICGLVWLACAVVKVQWGAQHDAMRSLELQKQLSSAHLRALQMQLEPHFLFNTLNAVTTLVELNRKDEALEILEHLNTILKSVLKRNTPSKIPLAQELEIVESYLAIERVRFADRLRVDINLDPGALDGLVPCFLLQPIVENAIRHGISQRESEGCIETTAKRVGARMELQVRDNGPGANGKSHPGFGVGLGNTKERLIHFYQDDYELQAHEPESGGFEVRITIPYEKSLA